MVRLDRPECWAGLGMMLFRSAHAMTCRQQNGQLMKHPLVLGVAVAASLSCNAYAQSASHSKIAATQQLTRRKPPAGTGVALSPVRALLRTHVERVDWDEMPFGDVIKWLRAQKTSFGKVSIVARWQALAAAGIDDQTPITLTLEDVTVGVILDEVLDQLPGHDPVTYLGQGNVLKISTKSNLRGKMYTRTYDIAALMTRARAVRVSPRLDVGHQVHIVTAFGVADAVIGVTTVPVNVGTSLFHGRFDDKPPNDDNDDDDDAERDEQTIAQLIEWIQTTVEPDTWQVNGGPGTLAVFDSMLLVRNSADVHALLGGSFDFAR